MSSVRTPPNSDLFTGEPKSERCSDLGSGCGVFATCLNLPSERALTAGKGGPSPGVGAQAEASRGAGHSVVSATGWSPSVEGPSAR